MVRKKKIWLFSSLNISLFFQNLFVFFQLYSFPFKNSLPPIHFGTSFLLSCYLHLLSRPFMQTVLMAVLGIGYTKINSTSFRFLKSLRVWGPAVNYTAQIATFIPLVLSICIFFARACLYFLPASTLVLIFKRFQNSICYR